jgi:predicted Zn finger-like uncharacterized protein
MIITCPNCQSRYKFDEGRLADRPKVKTRCTKCGGTIEIENPMLGAFTLPPGNMSPAAEPPPTTPAQPAPGNPIDTQRNVPMVRGPLNRGGEGDVGNATITGRDLHKAGVIELPKDKRFSLAVIQGAATGQIYSITKTRTTMGRSGADINLDDPEASRQHAALEILGETAILRDLGSTNGTFVDIDRIDQHQLNNQMEFRIGSHVLMFIVTEVE